MNPALGLLLNVVVMASVLFVQSIMLILCPVLRDEPGRAGREKAEAIRDMIEFKIERRTTTQ